MLLTSLLVELSLKCLSLCWISDFSRILEKFITVVGTTALYGIYHIASILFRCRCRGKTRKISRHDFLFIQTYLPGAALIREENNLIAACVDLR